MALGINFAVGIPPNIEEIGGKTFVILSEKQAEVLMENIGEALTQARAALAAKTAKAGDLGMVCSCSHCREERRGQMQ